MFLIGNISGNLITALKFHLLKWLLIYGSKHGKYWFSHIFHCNFTTVVSTEVKLWFLSSLEHFWPDPKDTLSEVALFFEKMHKVFKNKVQGCSTPLSTENKYLAIWIRAWVIAQLIESKCRHYACYQSTADVAVMKRHQWLDKIQIFLPTHPENQKSCLPENSCQAYFVWSHWKQVPVHVYNKRMLIVQDCIKFRSFITWQWFLVNNFADFPDVVWVKKSNFHCVVGVVWNWQHFLLHGCF